MASFLLSVRLRGVATEPLQLLCWLKRDEVDCWAPGGTTWESEFVSTALVKPASEVSLGSDVCITNSRLG